MKKIKKIGIITILTLLFTLSITACKPKVQTLTVSKMPINTEYTVGDGLDITGAELTVKMSKGEDKVLTLDAAGVDYSPKILTDIGDSVKITVSYQRKTTSFNVRVIAKVTAISVASLPVKTTGYIVGRPLDFSGGTVKLTYEDHDPDIFSMTDPIFDISPTVLTDSNVIDGNAIVTIKLKLNTTIFTTFTLSGIENIKILSMELIGKPAKKDYTVTELLDLTGGQIKVNYNDATKDGTFPMSDGRFKVSGFAGTPGINTIKIEGVGQEVAAITFDVTVDTSALVEKIEIESQIKKRTYYVGESLDFTGGVIRIYYTVGGSSVSVLRDMGNPDIFKVDGFSSLFPSEKIITVELKKMSDTENRIRKTFTVSIKNDTVASITKKSNPAKSEYYRYEELDLTGGIVTLIYDSKKTIDVPMDDTNYFTVVGDVNGQGNVIIYVYLNENTQKIINFSIYIYNNTVDSITIIQEPVKNSYSTGECLNYKDGKIRVTYKYPANNPVEHDYDMDSDYFRNNFTASGYNNTAAAAGNQTVIITLKSNLVNVSAKLFDAGITFTPRTIKRIEILKYPSQYAYYTKQTYETGMAPTEWNLSGGLVRLIYEPLFAGDNYEGVASMDDSVFEVSKIDIDGEGIQVISLTYGACDAIRCPVMVYDMYNMLGLTYYTYLDMRMLAKLERYDSTYLLMNFNEISEMMQRYIGNKSEETYMAAYEIFNENGIIDKEDYPYNFQAVIYYMLTQKNYEDLDTHNSVSIMDFYDYISNFVYGTYTNNLYINDAAWWGIYGKIIKDDAEFEFLDFYLAAARMYSVNQGKPNINDMKAGDLEGLAVLEKLAGMFLNLSPQHRYNFLSIVSWPDYYLYDNYKVAVMNLDQVTFTNMMLVYTRQIAENYKKALIDNDFSQSAANQASSNYRNFIETVLFASENQAVIYECERVHGEYNMQSVLAYYINQFISKSDVYYSYLKNADVTVPMDETTLKIFEEFKKQGLDYVTESLFRNVYLILADTERAYADMLYDPTEFLICYQSYLNFIDGIRSDEELNEFMPDVQEMLNNRDYPRTYIEINGIIKYSDWIDRFEKYYGAHMAAAGEENSPVRMFIDESVRLLTLLLPLGIASDKTREAALNKIITGSAIAGNELENTRQALAQLFDDFLELSYSQKISVFRFFDTKYGDNINVEFFPYSRSLFVLFSAHYAMELKTTSYNFSYENLLRLILLAVERDAAFSQDEFMSGNRFAALEYIASAKANYQTVSTSIQNKFAALMTGLDDIKSRLTQNTLTGNIVSISIESADTIVFQKGEQLNKDAIYIMLTDENGDTEVVRLSDSRFTVTGYEKVTEGVQKLIVTDKASGKTTYLLIYVFDYNALMDIALAAYDAYINAFSTTYPYAGDAAILILLIKNLEETVQKYYKNSAYAYNGAAEQDLDAIKAAVIDIIENGDRSTDDYRINKTATAYLNYMRKVYITRIVPYLGVIQKTNQDDANVTTWLNEIWAGEYEYELTDLQQFFLYYIGIVVEYQKGNWNADLALDLWNSFIALSDDDQYFFLNLLDTPGFESKLFNQDGLFDYSVLCNGTQNNVFSIIMASYYDVLIERYGDYEGYAFSATVYATEFFVLLKYWYANKSNSPDYQSNISKYSIYLLNYLVKVQMEYLFGGMNEEQIRIFQELFGEHYNKLLKEYMEFFQ